MTKTREIALGGIYSAVSIVFLYIACFFPTMKLTFAFAASCMPTFACAECKSRKTSLLCGIASGIIALFLLPKQGIGGLLAIVYSASLCYYPSIKSLFETKLNLIWEWIVKLVYFTTMSVLIKFITLRLGIDIFNIFIYIAAFVVYDLLLTAVIGFYLSKISPALKKQL